jgi:betaine-aldehyde dehydrogenase
MPTPDTSLHLDGALFIDGAWRAAASGDTRQVINPFDGSALQHVDEGAAGDALAAVAAAR